MQQPHPFSMQWITDDDAFLLLKDQWNDLVVRSYPDNPLKFFYLHEWFDSAWAWAKQSSQLKILAAFHAEKLAAIVPLKLQTQHYRGLPFKQLEFLAVPDTQQCDFIIAHSHAELLPFLLKKIWADRSWDKLRLHYLPQTSLLSNSQLSFPEEVYVQQTTQHPIVQINTDWDSYYLSRSRRLKKGNNLTRNHLQKQGKLSVERIDMLPTDTVLNIVRHISQHSWKEKTQTTFDQSAPLAFLQQLTQYAKRNHWLQIWVLKLNQEPIAYEYQMVYERQVYALRSDYLQQYAALSPGTYLNWQILQNLFQQNMQTYHMGPGENAYKHRWSNENPPVYTLCAYQNNWLGKLLKAVEQQVIPRMRPLKQKIQAWMIKEDVRENVQ